MLYAKIGRNKFQTTLATLCFLIIDLQQQIFKKLMIMIKAFKFLMFASILLIGDSVKAKNTIDDPPQNITYPIMHRSPKRIIPASVAYNATSTTLSVCFPTASGGRVEIYRNSTLVVSENTASGTAFCYMLNQYGTGFYSVVVRVDDTIVYIETFEVE